MAAAGWLVARAASYHRDAQRLEREGGDIDGMTGEQWGIVYRAVSAELTKCAGAVFVAGLTEPGEVHVDGLMCQAESRDECDNDAHWEATRDG